MDRPDTSSQPPKGALITPERFVEKPRQNGDMATHVQEVDGPEGHFVVRAERRGVSSRQRLIPFQGLTGAFVRRFLTRDRAWVICIRSPVDDPLGSPLWRHIIASRAEIPSGMALAEGLIRGGRVGDASSEM